MEITSLLSYIASFIILSSCNTASEKPNFHHTAVRVADMNRSVQFYSEVFDLKVIDEIDTLRIADEAEEIIVNVDIKFLSFSDDGHILELIGNQKNDSLFYSPHQHLAISVTDIEETYANALRLGAIAVRAPKLVFAEGKEVKNAFIKGLDGENIELMQWIE